jgi:hypothetical protein
LDRIIALIGNAPNPNKFLHAAAAAHPLSCMRKARKALRVTPNRPRGCIDVIHPREIGKKVRFRIGDRSGQLTICAALSGHDG